MKQIAGVKSTDKVKNIVLKFEKILKMFFCDWTFYRYCPQGIDIGNWITANNNDLLTLILCAKIKKNVVEFSRKLEFSILTSMIKAWSWLTFEKWNICWIWLIVHDPLHMSHCNYYVMITWWFLYYVIIT